MEACLLRPLVHRLPGSCVASVPSAAFCNGASCGLRGLSVPALAGPRKTAVSFRRSIPGLREGGAVPGQAELILGSPARELMRESYLHPIGYDKPPKAKLPRKLNAVDSLTTSHSLGNGSFTAREASGPGLRGGL